uniref:Uncharacterized protein n=1 Tax=Solanum lycopersicum TaxID=4081 RepID=K4CEJ3_SOLLC
MAHSFHRSILSHELMGFVDGSIPHYSPLLGDLEDLCTKLKLHEQRLQRFKELASPITHQAFAAHSVSTPIQDFCSEFGFGRGRGRSSSRSRGRGGKGRGFGGRVQQPQINSSNHNTHISAIG